MDDYGTCKCIKSPLDAFLEDCVLDCINGMPSLDVLPPGAASCDSCGGEVRLPGFCATCQERENAGITHPGPCEYDGGYGEGGAKVICSICLSEIHESKRGAR